MVGTSVVGAEVTGNPVGARVGTELVGTSVVGSEVTGGRVGAGVGSKVAGAAIASGPTSPLESSPRESSPIESRDSSSFRRLRRPCPVSPESSPSSQGRGRNPSPIGWLAASVLGTSLVPSEYKAFARTSISNSAVFPLANTVSYSHSYRTIAGYCQLPVGAAVGWRLGPSVGADVVGSEVVGTPVGPDVAGAPVGAGVGAEVVGTPVGAGVGSGVVGAPVGAGVGSEVVGALVGAGVGSEVVGIRVGAAVGSEVVGALVGAGVGSEVVGIPVGAGVGSEVGPPVGPGVGSEVVGSEVVGSEVVGSEVVGSEVVGSEVVGPSVGAGVGFELVGAPVGAGEGSEVAGVPVGVGVGSGVGSEVAGAAVGADEGSSSPLPLTSSSSVGAAVVGKRVGDGVGDVVRCLAMPPPHAQQAISAETRPVPATVPKVSQKNSGSDSKNEQPCVPPVPRQGDPSTLLRSSHGAFGQWVELPGARAADIPLMANASMLRHAVCCRCSWSVGLGNITVTTTDPSATAMDRSVTRTPRTASIKSAKSRLNVIKDRSF